MGDALKDCGRSRSRIDFDRQLIVMLLGGLGTDGALPPMLPTHSGHQQDVLEMKFWMACHLGGALLSGFTVSMKETSAPHSPYWLGAPMSL